MNGSLETATAARINGGGDAYSAGLLANAGSTGRFMAAGNALTEKQSRFVEAYVASGAPISNGARATEAATRAGYANPREDGWKLRKNRAVMAAIHDATTQLVVDGGAIGVGVLVEVAQDRAAPAAARVSAAKWLAEAAGHGLAARKAGELADDDRPLEERSIGELEQIAADLHAQLTRARMGVIEGESAQVQADAPNNAPALGNNPAQA